MGVVQTDWLSPSVALYTSRVLSGAQETGKPNLSSRTPLTSVLCPQSSTSRTFSDASLAVTSPVSRSPVRPADGSSSTRDQYARRVPSGDQTGSMSTPGPDVTA